MIQFKLDNFAIKIDTWALHHKDIGVLYKRVDKNGNSDVSSDDKILALEKKYPDRVKPKKVSLWSKEEGLVPATDYYILLPNTERPEVDVDYYSVRASNTKQVTHFRLEFQLEYSKFYLDHSFKSSGSHAMPFQSLICSDLAIYDVVGEILEKNLPIEKTGISKGHDNDYKILVVDQYGEAIDIEVSLSELEEGFIGATIYKFEQEIVEGNVDDE